MMNQGFQGPLMGMKSAWSHVQSDYVLFVPCDVTYIPKGYFWIISGYAARSFCEVAVVEINDIALYPFCLLKRSSLPTLVQHLEQNQRSLRHCFAKMHIQRRDLKIMHCFSQH